MTFLDGVVNVVSIQTSTSGSQFNTFYTVPSGRFAMVSIEALQFNSTSAANNLRLTRDGEIIEIFDPTLNNDRATAVENGSIQFFLRAGDSLQLRSSSPSANTKIFCTALEYNLP